MKKTEFRPNQFTIKVKTIFALCLLAILLLIFANRDKIPAQFKLDLYDSNYLSVDPVFTKNSNGLLNLVIDGNDFMLTATKVPDSRIIGSYLNKTIKTGGLFVNKLNYYGL